MFLNITSKMCKKKVNVFVLHKWQFHYCVFVPLVFSVSMPVRLSVLQYVNMMRHKQIVISLNCCDCSFLLGDISSCQEVDP